MRRGSIDFVSIFVVLFATFLGGYVRFFPTILSDFPLNDGGLFYQMSQDVLDNNFKLPETTSYNHSNIPFGYPPLAFYALAFFQRVFHIEIIDQLHYTPAFISTLTIPAFYLLCKKITGSKERSLMSMLAFSLTPNSFIWLVMGGGITRSLGLLFSIFSILLIYSMFQKPKPYLLLCSIVLSSLTILSHPEITWFLFITAGFFGIRYGINKKGVLYAILTILGTLLATMPWWFLLIKRFTISLFENAAQTGGFFSIPNLIFYFTGEPFATIIAVIALLGLFAEISRRRYILAIWLLLISFLSPRSGPLLATIPGAILFGSGISWLLVPGLLSNAKRNNDDNHTFEAIVKNKYLIVPLGILMIYSFFSAISVPFIGLSNTWLTTKNDLQAMTWVAENTPGNSQFAVITGDQAWQADQISEWFPALTGRVSITTVQGSEWLPDDEFKRLIETNQTLQICAYQDGDCLDAWSIEHNHSITYIYLYKPQSEDNLNLLPLEYSLRSNDQYQLLFENSGASIYQVSR
jgi:hypothetical protein